MRHAKDLVGNFQEHLLDEYSMSLYQREMRLSKLHSEHFPFLPRITILRFGTVIGVSPSQRTDLLVPMIFKSSYVRGEIEVYNHNAMRSFLSLNDCARAFEALLAAREADTDDSKLNVWNLASFNASILEVANMTAAITGARLKILNESTLSGYTQDTRGFQRAFNFTFQDTLDTVLIHYDEQIPHSILPKGPWELPSKSIESTTSDIIPCPVCGATGRDQQIVLDLGSQPLANDFQSDAGKAMALSRHPLKLVRCKVCNHYHLSHLVDREDLFEHYIYQSGTSATLQNYFDWLAKKVEKDSGNPLNRSVLEIACNDGSQLDHFRNNGWQTFGVDPAVNLAVIAKTKGHQIRAGFWPLPFPELPPPENLTAIVAQNVLAHVPYPVSFLKGCAAIMGPDTKLYVQTSQCNMMQFGQFDTVYHEHISFFTGHSFFKASLLAGLSIVSFETTPIHGTSCLVTLKLNRSQAWSQRSPMSLSLKKRIKLENSSAINTDFFAERFSFCVHRTLDWLVDELRYFKSNRFTIGAFGAAAKGMVLLHSILDWQNTSSIPVTPEFVLDDAPPKQNTFCPGTSIPVIPTKKIMDVNTTDHLVILVLAWNFWDEIKNKLVYMLRGKRDEITVVLPFPKPRVSKINLKTGKQVVLRELLNVPTALPNHSRHKGLEEYWKKPVV